MTKREMILKGIEHWQQIEPNQWIASDVHRYIYEVYGERINNTYINNVRREIGESQRDHIHRTVREMLEKAISSY